MGIIWFDSCNSLLPTIRLYTVQRATTLPKESQHIHYWEPVITLSSRVKILPFTKNHGFTLHPPFFEFSGVRDKSIAPSSRPQYRYANPSSTKNSLFNLALRESFGGHIFGGSNRPAAMGSCITVMNAPTHIGSRFALRDTLIGHRNAIYCGIVTRTIVFRSKGV